MTLTFEISAISGMANKMNEIAFSKMILHAAKYPHCTVNGILLNNSSGTVVDCVPLFHLNLTVLPYLEMALNQIEVLCEDEKYSICGYYHINSSVLDDSPDHYVTKMMEKLTENLDDRPVLFMVDNQKLNTKEPPYKNYEYRDGKLVSSQKVPLDSGALEFAMNQVRKGTEKRLVDFDNHLDDIKLDWRNRSLLDH